jgi:hypothetical protein
MDYLVNKKISNHSFAYFLEKNRRELVLKSLKQSPERVERSKDYKITGRMEIDVEEFLGADRITVEIPVNQYTCTIIFNHVIENIIKVVDLQYRGNVNFAAVEKALSMAIDNEKDLKVNCTCKDFYYRFSYVATKGGYKSGYAQTRPAPIRNPKDNKGSFCKHLIMILKNKKWVHKLAEVVNYLVKEYYDDIIKKYDLDPDYFYINWNGRNNPKFTPKYRLPGAGRSKKDKSKYQQFKSPFADDTILDSDDDDINDDEEDLKLRVR